MRAKLHSRAKQAGRLTRRSLLQNFAGKYYAKFIRHRSEARSGSSMSLLSDGKAVKRGRGRPKGATKAKKAALAAGQRTLPFKPVAEGSVDAFAKMMAASATAAKDSEAQAATADAISTTNGVEQVGEATEEFKDLWADTSLQQIVALTNLIVPSKRRNRGSAYTFSEVTLMLAVYDRVNEQLMTTERALKSSPFPRVRVAFEQVSRGAIRRAVLRRQVAELHQRWQTLRKTTLGRPVVEAFEQEVADELIIKVVRDGFVKVGKGKDKAITKCEVVDYVANAVFSFEMVRFAAVTVAGRQMWAANTRVARLKFSNHWVQGWLRRQELRRRRITAVDKKRPTPEEVNKTMLEIQKVIVEEGFTLDEIINADETGVFYAQQPQNKYVNVADNRAAAPDADDKERHTAMLAATAKGALLPSFNIAKCFASRPQDLSKTTILTELHKQHGYTAADGWMQELWEDDVIVPEKTGSKKNVSKRFKRPFLLHSSGHVITLQKKGWMDTAGLVMWIQLVLKQYMAKHDLKKMLMVWDSCSSHLTKSVVDAFTEANITVLQLPVNMTDKLQPMDLVVNGPLKAGIRRDRCFKIYEALQDFRTEWAEAKADAEKLKAMAMEKRRQADAASEDAKAQDATDVQIEAAGKAEEAAQKAEKDALDVVMPTFHPPAPDRQEGLTVTLELVRAMMTNPKMAESIRNCFVTVGLAPVPVPMSVGQAGNGTCEGTCNDTSSSGAGGIGADHVSDTEDDSENKDTEDENKDTEDENNDTEDKNKRIKFMTYASHTRTRTNLHGTEKWAYMPQHDIAKVGLDARAVNMHAVADMATGMLVATGASLAEMDNQEADLDSSEVDTQAQGAAGGARAAHEGEGGAGSGAGAGAAPAQQPQGHVHSIGCNAVAALQVELAGLDVSDDSIPADVNGVTVGGAGNAGGTDNAGDAAASNSPTDMDMPAASANPVGGAGAAVSPVVGIHGRPGGLPRGAPVARRANEPHCTL